MRLTVKGGQQPSRALQCDWLNAPDGLRQFQQIWWDQLSIALADWFISSNWRPY